VILPEGFFYASTFTFIGFVIFLMLWEITEIDWIRYARNGCLLTAIASFAVAFAAQSASQAIRIAEYFRAKTNGEKPREFKEGAPEYARIIAKCYRFTRSSGDKEKLCISIVQFAAS
jgi:hypothetical protein